MTDKVRDPECTVESPTGNEGGIRGDRDFDHVVPAQPASLVILGSHL